MFVAETNAGGGHKSSKSPFATLYFLGHTHFSVIKSNVITGT